MPHLTREEIITFTQRVTKDMEFLNAALEEGIEDAATADWLKTEQKEYQSLSYSLRRAMPNIKEDAECIEKSVVTLDDEEKGFIASSSTMSQASSSSDLAGVNFTGSPVPKQFPTPRFESMSPPPRRTLPVIYESALPERLPTSMSPIHEGKRKRTGELFLFNVPARRTIRSPPSPVYATNSNRIPPLARPWGPGPTTPGHISNSPNYASPAPGPRSPNAGSPSHSSQGSPFSALLPPRHSVFSPSLYESPPSQAQEEKPHSSVGNESNTFIHMPAPHGPMPSLTHSIGFNLHSAVSSSSRPVRARVPEALKRYAALPFSGGRGRGATPSSFGTISAFRSSTPLSRPPTATTSEPNRRDARSQALPSETSSPPPSKNEPSDHAMNHAAEVDLLLQQDEKARRERKIIAERFEREAILRRLYDEGGLRVEPEDDDEEVEFIMERAREPSLDDDLKSRGTTIEEGTQERKRKAQLSSRERASVRRRYV